MIDGKGPFSLLFDSGSEIMVVKPYVAKACGLTIKNGTTEVKGPTGGYVPVGQAEVDTLQIAGLTIEHPFCTVEDTTMPCDGLIGAPLMNAGIVQVDLPDKIMTTFAAGTYTPTVSDSPLDIDFSMRRVPVVPAEVGGISGKFEIDTGSSSQAELYPDFIKANDLTSKFPDIGTVGRTSIGGRVFCDVYDMKELTVGGQTIQPDGPLATVFIDASQSSGKTGYDGRIGCPMLVDTTLTFDYPHAKMYFRVGGASGPTAAAVAAATQPSPSASPPQPAAPSN